jgi:hypothetical protein
MGLRMALLGLFGLRAHDLLCDWHFPVFSCIIQPAAGRGEGVSPLQPIASPQSPVLPACANRAIEGTIRVLDAVILTSKEGARCDE